MNQSCMTEWIGEYTPLAIGVISRFQCYMTLKTVIETGTEGLNGDNLEEKSWKGKLI